MTPQEHIDRAVAQLVAGDLAAANTHALLAIAALLTALVPPPTPLTLCPTCQQLSLNPEGNP